MKQAWQQTSKVIPVYWRATLEYLYPLSQIMSDGIQASWDFCYQWSQPLREWINRNIPQHLEKIEQEYYPKLCSLIKIGVGYLADFAEMVANQTNETAFKVSEWLKTNVFKDTLIFQNLTLTSCVDLTSYYINEAYNKISSIIKQ